MSYKLPNLVLQTSMKFGARVCSVNVCSVRHNRTHIDHAKSAYFKTSYRTLPHPKEKVPALPRVKVPHDFRTIYPEFLPIPVIEYRNKLREKLERRDMLERRANIDMPEFYIGSIMAVTVNDPNATGKTSRFVGLCIDRGGSGLRAWFTLRNVIDHQGLEIMYDMYCPLITSIETLRLEKRPDEHLLFLRDALPEYSTFPQDMEQELIAEGSPVPVNDIKVRMQPKPWHSKWERKEVVGINFEDHLTDDDLHLVELRKTPDWVKYDLMKEYRATIPEEEQEAIFSEIAPQYPSMKRAQRQFRRRREE